jgi:ankyrin repeat protein
MTIPAFPIHRAASVGDVAALRELLAGKSPELFQELQRVTPEGYTALMCAVASPRADAGIVRMLLEAGAEAGASTRNVIGFPSSAMSVALGGGDPAKVQALVDAGASVHSVAGSSAGILLAVYGRDLRRDPRLLDLLRLLIAQRVDLDHESEYRETALRVLSRLGRFDAVKLLLDAGANDGQLRWTALHHAVALGNVDDVRREVDAGADLEAREWWERTPFLLAISAGHRAAAELLRERGADTAAVARCAKPALFHAIEIHDIGMLEWLLSIGADPAKPDEFGCTPLIHACELDDADAVRTLLARAVDIHAKAAYTALESAQSVTVARMLLKAGADPAQITNDTKRLFVGLPARPSVHLVDASDEDFRRGAAPRFGEANPQEMHEPFWLAMIRAGVNAYSAVHEAYEQVEFEHPVWCADRFGQSFTLLPDGRIIQIAGEHEDSYDPDFCIYNDVFVHHNGSTRIFGYPKDVFPPTDFHTATLIGRSIWIIGSLGYLDSRQYGTTPVFTLDTETFRIARVLTTGEGPGWIYRHRADLAPGGEIVVGGGVVAAGVQQHEENSRQFALDTAARRWRLIL